MEKLKIIGGNKLSGSISCSGAKNAALPMLAATILSDQPITFKNLPYLQDITTMFELLGSMGADITLNESMDFIISTSKLHDFEARYELVKTMRASILVLGSLELVMVLQESRFQVAVRLEQDQLIFIWML